MPVPRPKHLALVAENGVVLAQVPARHGRAVRRGMALRHQRQVQLCILREHLGHINNCAARMRELIEELETDLGLPHLDMTPGWTLPDFPAHPDRKV